MMEQLQVLDAFWKVKNQYDLIRGRYVYCVTIFDGEPCISGGVGNVSGWQEVNTKAETLGQAVDEAVARWNAGQFDEVAAT